MQEPDKQILIEDSKVVFSFVDAKAFVVEAMTKHPNLEEIDFDLTVDSDRYSENCNVSIYFQTYIDNPNYEQELAEYNDWKIENEALLAEQERQRKLAALNQATKAKAKINKSIQRLSKAIADCKEVPNVAGQLLKLGKQLEEAEATIRNNS